MLKLYLLNNILKNIRWGGGKEGGWINLAAPDRMQKNLAASCILEIVLEERLAAIHIWIYIPSSFAIALLIKEMSKCQDHGIEFMCRIPC